MAIAPQNNSSPATTPEPTMLQHQIVIIGGGSAGITVAAQLMRQNSKLDIAIIEPSSTHYYQPAWTLVGGGQYQLEKTAKPEGQCIPSGVAWIQDEVTTLDPDENLIRTQSGQQIHYDYLVACPGIQIDWHLIKGLTETLGSGGVCSNYAYKLAPYTSETLRTFEGGNAIFTFPTTPIKCAGAPQKTMYLADDIFRKNGVREQTNLMYCSAVGTIFAVKGYANSLLKVVARKGIALKFKHNLKEIRAASKEAVFNVTTEEGVSEAIVPYEMIHVAPPMSAPDFIKTSKLAVPNSLGWVDVQKASLFRVTSIST